MGRLHVDDANIPVSVNRPDNGTLVWFLRAGGLQGDISVTNTTVSYNAFTGSHYAWTDDTIEPGTLVALTGQNKTLSSQPDSEPLYGIVPSATANNPRCLGAYLARVDVDHSSGYKTRHLVAAVGNGEMWVVDTGTNINPGDYLISSDVAGHAMQDDEQRFPVGYVIARVAEPVGWSHVSDTIDGRKHKRISVFFESFERGSAAAVGKIVERQQREIEELRERVMSLESLVGLQTQVAAMQQQLAKLTANEGL